MRGECSKRWALPTSGILLQEQSTPRHNDLKAGIWIVAIRRARLLFTFQSQKTSASYSQFQWAERCIQTSNGFTLADPNDRGMLDVVGFDTTVPAVIADFVRE